MGISKDGQYTRQIAQGRNRLAFLAIVAGLLAVFLLKEWSQRRNFDQRVIDAVNEAEAVGRGTDNVERVIIGPATAAFGGLALGATGLALFCGFAWWFASMEPKIAFGLSAMTGLALILAAIYGFSLVPEEKASWPTASPGSTLLSPRDAARQNAPAQSPLGTTRRGQAARRALVMGSLPALFAGFFMVGFSLSSLRATDALLRAQGGAARKAT